MPWKGEKDPYKIWLSEIILQQTRVEQGLGYYKKFIEQFPGIKKLASAPDDKVYKLWEGLGYYNRCKNLLESARFISNNLDGIFPDTYEEILQLKGIGTYTASAISSFAYNLPHAVVDGNVFRVLSRVFGINKAIDSTEGKKYFTKLANELLDKKKPAVYNQAIMDFGAIICKPVNPDCGECCFKKHCVAFQKELINKLPVKKGKIKIRERWLYYIMMEYRNKIYIKQRTGNDIWKNLYEFALLETGKKEEIGFILKQAVKKRYLPANAYTIQHVSPVLYQMLSHQKISGQLIKVKLKKAPTRDELIGITPAELSQYAFPKFINSFLNT